LCTVCGVILCTNVEEIFSSIGLHNLLEEGFIDFAIYFSQKLSLHKLLGMV
jgi:hypothetical protein